jgi:hypothetical protein
MGADIIIDSYIGFSENTKPQDIRSIVGILTCCSFFQGINDTKVQIPKTDIFIVPDLKSYGVESFSKMKLIVLSGEKAARDSSIYKKLKELGKKYKSSPDIQHKKDSLGNIRIDKIMVSGSPKVDNKLIEDLCNIYPGMEMNHELIGLAVDK